MSLHGRILTETEVTSLYDRTMLAEARTSVISKALVEKATKRARKDHGRMMWQAHAMEIALIPAIRRKVKSKFNLTAKRVKGGYLVATMGGRLPWNPNNPDPSIAWNAYQRRTDRDFLDTVNALRDWADAKTRREADAAVKPYVSEMGAFGVWIDNQDYLALPEGEDVSLHSRIVLTEYGGIGGRVAGARKPIPLPLSPSITMRGTTLELVKKRKREMKRHVEVRERLRQLAIEDRRPLKTLGESGLGGGIKVGSRVRFPKEVGKLAHSVWEVDGLSGPGGKVILYRVGKGGKTMSALQPGKNLAGMPIERFRKMVRSGDAVIV